MPDRLYEDIERAIGLELDGRLFERCAVDLLREAYYPDLRGTPHGRDAGMDGISGPDNDPEFILVATTSNDFPRNLRSSEQRYVDAGGPCRTVVFATTRKVTGDRRLRLRDELKCRWRVQLLAVHDQGDFIHLLYHDPQWRRDLLNVAGIAKALSRLPANARPILPIPLIGRDGDLERLRAVSADLVLVGKPGVGKTFLLEQLAAEDWCLFDSGWNIVDLEDAIREMRPRRIVIDDAHFDESDRISQIRRLGREMEAEFSIVAVSWPGQADVVAVNMRDAVRIEIEELEGDQIVQLVEAVGVVGPPDLQRLIVKQARGCAGLAVTLALACVAGRAYEVATGRALLEDLAGWYRRTLGNEIRHTLGVLALAGEHGATLAQVREVLGLPLPRISEVVRGMASGGTIDEVPGPPNMRMRVQPETLRYALVGEVFFSGPGALNVASAVDCLDSPSIAAIPIIGAIHRGAAASRDYLRSIVNWSDGRAAKEYALLGPVEFQTALAEAPLHKTRVAGAAYEVGIEPGLALQILMEQAVDDDRAENSTPDHPLRLVGDYLGSEKAGIQERRTAVDMARTWLSQGGDGEVGVRVLMHTVHPEMRSVSTDPGLGNTINIRESVVPLSWIDDLTQLWDEILGIVECAEDLPPAPLLEGLHYWVQPDILGFGRGPDEETVGAIRNVAARVIERLSHIFQARPGALSRLRDYAEGGELPVEVDIPEEFATLFPMRWRGREGDGELEDWEWHAHNEVARLGEALGNRAATDIAALIVDADASAAAAGINYPRHTPRLAQILAANLDEPEALLAALDERGAAPDIVLPLLDRTVDVRRPGWESALARQLDSNQNVGTAISTALRLPCGHGLKRLAVRKSAQWLSVIDALVFRDEIDDGTLALLFDAPDLPVRLQAAIALGTVRSGGRLADLPASTLARWREIIIESPADHMSLPPILEHDHQLCADWLRAWFERIRRLKGYQFLHHAVADAIAALPVDVRVALIGDIPPGVLPDMLWEPIKWLVSDDLQVAIALFDRSDIEDVHRAALFRGPSEAWMDRALLAVDRGWQPDEIVGLTLFSENVGMGEESQIMQGKIDGFASLRRGAAQPDGEQRERIIAAGIACFERMRDDAAERERQERIFGWEAG